MKVSVVIPVYQAAAFVEQAVESALAQPETGEVLLVEDGSPDGSLAVCERLAAARGAVRLLRHPNGENRGAGASRNLGIEQAACPLVAFLDADDYYLPGRFAGAVSILSAQPEVDGVYDDVEIFVGEVSSQRRQQAVGWPDRAGVRGTVAPEDLFESMVAGGAGVFHTDGIVVRRGLFEKSGVFDPRFRTAQDTHLWIRMAATGRLVPGAPGFVAARCRIHAGNRVMGRPRWDHVEGVRQVWADLIRWGDQRKLPPRWIQLLARRYVAASRGMVLERPLLRAWGTAAQTLAFLLLHCPQPWRVEGGRNLLREASGIGLAADRAVDRIVYGPSKPVPEGAPSLALVIVWFGPWPFWMRAFLLSCRHNPTVDWLIFSDTEPPADMPGNVKILPMGLEAFNRRATQALGFEVKVQPDYAYKMCDLKIMYGRIFEAELAKYDFWGCCDMDVVWGDIRRFLTPELLGQFDVVTSRPGRISGHFCLFRNRPEWADLFRRIPDVAERADSGAYRRIDEDGLTDLLQRYERSPLRRLWARRAKGLPVPKVYWKHMLAPNGRRQRRLLENPALSMRWRDGRAYDADGEEMMYLHFHKIRDRMNEVCFDPGTSLQEFTVTPNGFFAVGEGTR